MSRTRVAGGFTWTGWEYKGEDGGWPSVTSHFGILDEAGFPKDRYYWFKQLFQQPDPPLVHLLPHWNWDTTNSSSLKMPHLAECDGPCHRFDDGSVAIDVWVYTNADEAELFVNGKSRGRVVAGSLSHGVWKAVAFEPGTIEARVYKNGSTTVLASETIATTGPAAGFRVSIKDDVGAQGIEADRSDLALVQVEIVDGDGRLVPTASNLVAFEVGGPGQLIGTGNGDPHCHVSDKSPSLPAFHGFALGVVQGTLTPGLITVTVEVGGLSGTKNLTISSFKPTSPKPRL